MPYLSKQFIDESCRNNLSPTLASVLCPLLCHFENGRGCISVQKEENQPLLKVHQANTEVHLCACERKWEGSS